MWHRIHRLGSSRRHLWSKERLGYLAGGSKPLFDALLARIAAMGGRVHTGVRVDSIVVEAGHARGLVVGGEKIAFDRVVAALPLPAFARLLPAGHEDLRDSVARIRFIAVVCVVLLLERPLTGAFWVNIVDPELSLSGVIEYTNLDPIPELGGRSLVYVPYYVPVDHPLFHGKDQPIVAETVAGLERIVPHFRPGQVVAARVFRDRHAQPVCPPGFGAMVPPVATGIEGLFLVDSTQLYPSDRSRSGMIGIVRRHARELFGDCP
jgi:protoporphyrinogen oxidase